MGQKKHKKLRRTARLMTDMKVAMAKTSKAPLIPPEQAQYHTGSQVRNNPLTERGTIRWLKRNARK